MSAAALRAFALPLLCAVLLPVQTSASSSREWRFEVFLDDKPIGFHHFQLNTAGDTSQLHSEARFRVKVLGLTVYRYDHQSRELWQHECLHSIEASTDDNGKDLFVRGSRSDNQLLLEHHAGSTRLPGCVMTFAYWDPAILKQQRLLNVQTGEYVDVEVQPLGEQTLQAQGRSLPALHYRISTGQSDIELWYSDNRDWLALSSSTRGGRQLHYRRTSEPTPERSVK